MEITVDNRNNKPIKIEAAPGIDNVKVAADSVPVVAVPKKKRGRPSKKDANALIQAPKKRGRPPKAASAKKKVAKKATTKKAQTKRAKSVRGPGRPRKETATQPAVKSRKSKNLPDSKLYPMKLNAYQLLQYRTLIAEVGEAAAILKRSTDKVLNEQNKKIYQPLMVLLEQQRLDQQEHQKRIKKLADLQLKIGEKFGVTPENLHEYAINPENGVMLHDPPNKKEAVASPEKKDS